MLRRTLIRLLAGVGLAPRLTAAVAPARATPPEPDTLVALAAAVLPASLGGERIDAVVAGFRSWQRGYSPGADRGHGYGHTRLVEAPQSPAAGYARQLDALEAVARTKGAARFSSLGAADQHAVLDAALKAAQVERLPERPDGRHVAADLLAYFFRSSEANDLCYRAQIGRDTCRGLADSPETPRRLEAAAGASRGARLATGAPRGDAGS